MKKDFAETLKELRVNAGYSQKQVYDMLGIRQSTFSAWETGRAEPSADMLLKLCKIYKVNDIFSAFGYDGYKEDGSLRLNLKENELIEKYRSLDSFGQETVDIVIEREIHRQEELEESRKKRLLTYEEALKKMQGNKSQYEYSFDSPVMMVAEDHVPYGSKINQKVYTYMNRIACAGSGFYFDDIPTDTIEAPYKEEADFIIGVNGDSMEPDYHDGEKLYVKKSDHLNPGDVGIFTINNECFLKELDENGLISRNKSYNDIPGTEDVRLIGSVIGKVEES